jgi:glycosyltransferase involved in cell wall biosynthesis
MIHYITPNGIGLPGVVPELGVVDRRGVPFVLHTLRAPRQSFHESAWAAELDRATRAIYPVAPGRFVLSVALAPFLFGRRFAEALANAFFGERESVAARLKALVHFLVACHWARERRGEQVDHIHIHWIHNAGTVGMYGAWLLGIPYSFTGHAVDLFRDRVALADKIRRADFIVCISRFHRDFYKQHGARDAQLQLIYCGVDTREFPFRRNLSREGLPRIISVGRLVEKKGFDVLIAACRVLADRGITVDCEIAGRGPLEQALRDQIASLGLETVVKVNTKPIPQEKLAEYLTDADIYAQPCVWAKDNDVDGTPRTLCEAMACGTPAVSTPIAGIPDIIDDGDSGLLVEPGDAVQLADALERLLKDRPLAERLSRGGRERIEQRFDLDHCVDPLVRLFQDRLKTRAPLLAAVAAAPEAVTS